MIWNERFWFECQLNPDLAEKYYDLVLPRLPPKDVQIRFTGRHGRKNLKQALEFYKYVCTQCAIETKQNPRILDFGGGWGRISRFFLRNAKAENIWISDVLTDSVYWLKETGAKYTVVKNNPLPPVLELQGKFDLIYAFSVFSHLSEEYFLLWINFLLSRLQEGGYLVFTSRGNSFIERLRCKEVNRAREIPVTGFPASKIILEKFRDGVFQFYPSLGGGELTDNFYGEAFVPIEYVKKHFEQHFVTATENVPQVDQTVFVLKNNGSKDRFLMKKPGTLL